MSKLLTCLLSYIPDACLLCAVFTCFLSRGCWPLTQQSTNFSYPALGPGALLHPLAYTISCLILWIQFLQPF